MNILVTGSKGQLGNELQVLAPGSEFNFTFTDFDELDLTDFDALTAFFAKNRFDFIINCAAYTAVDKAESEENRAFLLNGEAPGKLADIASKQGAVLIHISTDYVFNGRNYKPYNEDDACNPVSVYGHSKLKGEQAVLDKATKAIIIRTSWLYSSFGNNFVKSILKYSKERPSLNVVFDQVGTPTYASDLAKAIIDIIKMNKFSNSIEIFNYADEGVCSWYDFALEIINIKGINFPVHPIETKDYPTPAQRPHYSVLNKEKIKKHFGIKIPHWKNSLKECLNLIEDF